MDRRPPPRAQASGAPSGTREASERSSDRAAKTASLFEEIAHLALTGASDRAERLRDQVVMLNMGIAESIARRYRHRGISNDDLAQAAYLGLVKAVRGFDASRGGDFVGYAVPTISGEVKRYFRDFGWAVRPPRRVQELQARIASVTAELTQAKGRSPRPSEVADFLDVDVHEVIEALAADGCFTPTSLDLPVGESEVATLGELMCDDESGFDAAEARVLLAPVVRRLSTRDRRVLELRFFEGWTQEQIARDIGVTQMQVSRVLSRIMRQLREELA